MSRKRKGTFSRQSRQAGRSAKTTSIPWWKRPVIKWVGGIGGTLIAAIATATGTGIGQSMYNQLIGHSVPNVPTMGSLSISELGDNYQIVTPVFNLKQTDQQVQEISLDLIWASFQACGDTTDTYKVDETLLVNKANHTVEGVVNPKTGPVLGSVQVRGHYYSACGSNELSLTFRPPALILAANGTSLISIEIPKKFSVVPISRVHPHENPVQIPEVIVHPDVIYNTSTLGGGVAYLDATMTIQTNSGARMTGCEQVGYTGGGQRTKSC